MDKLILSVLEQFKDANLHSEAGRQVITDEIMFRVRDKTTPWFLNMNTIDGKPEQQLELFPEYDKYIYESPDGGETVTKRKIEVIVENE